MRVFCLDEIGRSLREFQREFPAINDRLAMRREELTELMIEQILEAYGFLNTLLLKEMDLFTPAGLYALLEMNHLVLCGSDPGTRMQYYQHLSETRKNFLLRIKPIKEWTAKKHSGSDAYQLASGFYTRMLSRPQLFLEGNHRTGNILLNYLLISKHAPPYIVSSAHAHTYLDLSGDIKFTEKGNSLDTALRMPGHRRRLETFLRECSSVRYITDMESPV